MPFSKITEFIKSFPAVKDLSPEQQKKAMDAFNGMMKDPKMDEGKAIATAMKQAKEMSEEEDLSQFFYVGTVDLAEAGTKTSRIEVLKVGKVHDRNLTITREMLDAFVKNYEEGTVGTEIQVNLRHDRGGEAAGWIRGLERVGDVLFADVEWTPLGVEKIKSKQYRFTSSELAASFPHHETGEPVKNVLIGVALTNIPAVKGLQAVTLSETAQSYISNFDTMKKFKELLASLMAKEVVTLSEFEELAKLADEAVEAGEVPADEAKESVEEVKEKVEEEKPEEPVKEEPAKEDLKEKTPKGLTKLSQQVESLAEENRALREKIELQELSEEIESELCLSEEAGRSTGFKPDKASVKSVAQFMLSLSQDQRAEFKKILELHQTVDLSVRGQSAGSSQVNLSEQEELKKANAEAQKRFSANPELKPLHEHLSDVFVEMGMVD